MIVRDCTGVLYTTVVSQVWVLLPPAGWQTDQCKYGPEKGVGVGDDVNSCAFDGARCKVWSGPPSEQHNNDYGREWVEGDTLSCLMSWTGDVSFWLGGVSQGVAFKAMNMNSNWYPAVSLAMDQQCVFNFGSKPFRCCFFTFLYFTLPYFTLLHFTSLHFTSLYFTLLYFTLLYFTLLYFTSLHFTSLHFTSLYFTLFYFTLLYSTSLHFTSLHFTLLYFYFTLLYFYFTF